MSAAWLPGNALSFDLETTSADPETARIVSATCVEVGAAGVVRRETWLVNPGIPIPAEATAVHGITDAMAAGGLDHSDSVHAISDCLVGAWKSGLPVIVMNAPFDITILSTHAASCCPKWLPVIGPVLDPVVIDRGIDPYRKGKRTLTALAAHYGVRLDGAHSSDGDALGAARVVWRQAKAIWALSKMTLAEMQQWQADAHFKWAVNFADYLRGKDPGREPSISTDWPLRRMDAITKRTA